MVLSWHLRDSTVDDDSLLYLGRCPAAGSWMNRANGSVSAVAVVNVVLFDGVVIGLTHSMMIVAAVDVVAAVFIGKSIVVDAESRIVLVVTGCRSVAGHGHHHNPSQNQNLRK